MALPYRKVVLLEGDPNMVIPVISTIRHSWFPDGVTSSSWVSIEPPKNKDGEKDYCRLIVNELALDILGDPKVVLLRGFPDRKGFREWLFRLVPLVEKPNSLLIWDIDGIIEKSDEDEWKGLRNEVTGQGQCVTQPWPLNAQRKTKNRFGKSGKPIDLFSEGDKIHYIMHSFQSKGCSITAANARLLLSMLGADRGLIDSEVAKLMLFCDSKSITEEMILSSVVPLAQDYPVWQFMAAFNTGSYAEIMASANAFLAKARERKDGKLTRPPEPELVMLYALKQCHWQLVAADLLCKGEDLSSGLRRMGASKDVEATRQKVWNKLGFHLRERAQNACAIADEKKTKTKEGEEEKSGQETLGYDRPIQNIVDFIQGRLIRLCPSTEPDAHVWVLLRTIDRFLIAQKALVQLRLAKKESAMALLGQELRKLSL